MEPFFIAYMTAWAVCCLAAVAMFVRERSAYVIGHREYWRYLAEPWKLATFAVAAAGLIVIAPYTGDHTWDYVDAAFMSIFTFATAPWAVGALYLVARRRLPARQAFVAACAWMFSSSWSYDGYLVLKYGVYPATWWSNILLSGVMYLSAGLMWNLQWKPGRGVIFGFMEPDWPQPPVKGAFARIAWFALPFIVLISLVCLQFFFW